MTVEQNTQEWLDLRKTKIGSSDAPIIMKESPFSTPYQLWEEKLGIRKREQNYAMSYGHQMEPVARDIFEKKMLCSVKPTVLIHPEYEWMMASLDGFNAEAKIATEIKNPNEEDHELAKSGKIPDKYWAQVQHQLEILCALYGINELHYFSHRKGDTALVTVEKDNEYIESMMKSENEFYENLINFTSPSLSEKDFLPIQDPEMMVKAEELSQLLPELQRLKKREKSLRDDLIKASGGRSCKGCGIQLKRYISKGSIDYGAIPQLQDIDLECYRKSPVEKYMITIEK